MKKVLLTLYRNKAHSLYKEFIDDPYPIPWVLEIIDDGSANNTKNN